MNLWKSTQSNRVSKLTTTLTSFTLSLSNVLYILGKEAGHSEAVLEEEEDEEQEEDLQGATGGSSLVRFALAETLQSFSLTIMECVKLQGCHLLCEGILTILLLTLRSTKVYSPPLLYNKCIQKLPPRSTKARNICLKSFQ